MTKDIFFWWLAKFDAHIDQAAGRKKLFLLESASAHDFACDL